jgi:hypothetical protein
MRWWLWGSGASKLGLFAKPFAHSRPSCSARLAVEERATANAHYGVCRRRYSPAPTIADSTRPVRKPRTLKTGRFLRIGGRREGRIDRAITDFTLTILESQSLCTSLQRLRPAIQPVETNGHGDLALKIRRSAQPLPPGVLSSGQRRAFVVLPTSRSPLASSSGWRTILSMTR